jgi:predicted ribosomally synthesized peptide with SipW-like signal peptide
MKEREFELSRRTILASIGGVGVASVAGGLGTSAFFSDREEFRNNRLVAGELDLKVDWEEHYSDWSPDEVEGLEFEPVMDLADIPTTDPGDLLLDPTDPDNWIAFPAGFGDLLYVWVGDVGQFMENTVVDAYPDADGDGLQDTIMTRQQIRTDPEYAFYSEEEKERIYREQFADVPDDLQGRPPLIALEDVKPGDFGEVTLSLHLFDNPGYIWLTGELVEAAENDHTEPEAKDPQETGLPDEGSANPITAQVELLDEIQVGIWHDDGNNLFTDQEVVVHRKPLGGPDDEENISLSREQALITQGTLREVLVELSSGVGVPLDADPTTSERDCFPNSTTRYLGFAWWLPVDHANEIQTDSVTFDLGFYTEQCRHNDGSGIAAEEPEPGPISFERAIDPKATYLRTNNDPGAGDTIPIDLGANGLTPGDSIRIEVLGEYTKPTTSTTTLAVFSASDTLLDSSQLNRVADAIDTGADATTAATFYGGLQTDIPEDFQFDSSVDITVPAGATHLFVAARDNLYQDNADSDGDYGVRITKL